MKMTLGTSDYVRDRGNLPELPVVNMFAEQSPSQEEVSLLSRSGLDTSLTLGSGPIRGIFKKDGVLSGQLFVVSGDKFYGQTAGLEGTVLGNDFVSFGAYSDRLFVSMGEDIYVYDGTTLNTVAFPDGDSVRKICVMSSRLIAIEKDTQMLWWSDPLTNTIDGLSFASAERAPDRLLDVLPVGDTLVLFGSHTVELWPVNDDPDLPFVPLIGRTYDRGIKNTGAACNFGSTVAWVTNQNEVCIAEPENVISYPGLSRKIAESDTAEVFTFDIDGIECIAVLIDDGTWVYHPFSKSWSRFVTAGRTDWIAANHADGYFGSKEDGKIYRFGTDYTDDGGVLERKFRAWLPINSGGFRVDNMVLRTNPGQTPNVSGDYVEPTVEMRLSKDGGMTWSTWSARSLGRQGEYRRQTNWNSLGMFGYPGVMVEMRVVDPIVFQTSGVFVNEPRGGA